jgi:hypothetical protein
MIACGPEPKRRDAFGMSAADGKTDVPRLMRRQPQ